MRENGSVLQMIFFMLRSCTVFCINFFLLHSLAWIIFPCFILWNGYIYIFRISFSLQKFLQMLTVDFNNITDVANVNECTLKYVKYSELLFSMLFGLEKKAVLEWYVKEDLIGSSYTYIKCGKYIKLWGRRVKKGINDSFSYMNLCG